MGKILTFKEACENLDAWVKKMKKQVKKRNEEEYKELEKMMEFE